VLLGENPLRLIHALASDATRSARLDMSAPFRDYVVRADGDAVVGFGVGGVGHVGLLENLFLIEKRKMKWT